MSTVGSSKKVDVKSNTDRLNVGYFLFAVIYGGVIIEELLTIFL